MMRRQRQRGWIDDGTKEEQGLPATTKQGRDKQRSSLRAFEENMMCWTP